jgi:hypothetical protein
MMKFLPSLLVSVFLAGVVSAVEPALVLHVSPEGNDAVSEGPFASLEGARDAIRHLKSIGALDRPVRVVVADGTYAVRRPFVLTPDDSGTAETPIIYEAAPGANPVFSGGRAIRMMKWNQDTWVAKIPEVAQGKWYFESLYVNGRRAVRARTPNEFYHYIVQPVTYGQDPTDGQIKNLANRAFIAEPADIAPLVGRPAAELNDVCMVAYHSWAISRHRLLDVDGETNRVVCTGPAHWGFGRWKTSRMRYHLENFKEALDEPGEWFLERDGTLWYKPRPGEHLGSAKVIAPVATSFVELRGDADLGMYVEHVTLRGLSFRHGDYILEPEGHSDAQAAWRIRGAIQADGARNVAIEGCEIAHVGTYGIWLRWGCRDVAIRHCYIHDLGAGGVRFGDGALSRPPTPNKHTAFCTVDDSIIRDGGHLFMGCCAVWIGHASDIDVTHNEISDFRYTGVSVGWVWNYGRSTAKRNHIEYNHIHHIGWGVLSDMGGVYMLGRSEGTTVSNNHIHHVYSYDRYGRGGWGLYTDQASSDILMENNLIHHTKTGGFHQHFGKDNILRNNIFAFSMDGQIQRSRKEDHRSFWFERNIVYWDNDSPLFSRSVTDPNVDFDHNLYWNTAGPVTFNGKSLEEWQALGKGEGSLIADPGFRDPEDGDFRLSANSPADQIGFRPFDYTTYGVRGHGAWRKLATSVSYPPVRFAPEPPPLPPIEITEDFETIPAGYAPDWARVYAEKRRKALAVIIGKPARGERCLAIRDAADFERPYNPHFYASPNYRNGLATCRFAIRPSADTTMYHEWRNDARPYRVGPSLRIVEGALLLTTPGSSTEHGKGKLGTRKLMDLPVDQWLEFEVKAAVGAGETGTWGLKVRLPDGTEKVWTGLPSVHEKWQRLTWVGFCSDGTKPTTWYLDDVAIHCGGE